MEDQEQMGPPDLKGQKEHLGTRVHLAWWVFLDQEEYQGQQERKVVEATQVSLDQKVRQERWESVVRKELLVHQDRLVRQAALEIMVNLEHLESLEPLVLWERGDLLDLRACRDSLVRQAFLGCRA